MVLLLVAAMVAGIALLLFGLILAADPEGRAGGRAVLCILAGLLLIVGCVIRFGWVAWQALSLH